MKRLDRRECFNYSREGFYLKKFVTHAEREEIEVHGNYLRDLSLQQNN